MIAFIDEHREIYGVEPICEVLPIAPSTYRDHVAKQRAPEKRPPRAQRDAALKMEVRRVFEENFHVNGTRKPGAVHAGPVEPACRANLKPPLYLRALGRAGTI